MSFEASAVKVSSEVTYQLNISNVQAEKLFALLAHVEDADLDDVFEALGVPVRGDYYFSGTIDGSLKPA